ncbi:MAG: DUF4286 family protein [Sphingobacteriales bacterium]|jgi:hypothetical protein
MIIYNVTSNVALPIADQWLIWMKDIHIPEVLNTGMFTHYRILRLLDVDESEAITYAVQYFASNRENCQKYLDEFAPALREKSLKQWGEQVISFRTLMEAVE